ncbi:WASH complex, F-actin capping protein, beta subunit [Rhodotorula toruloides]|uniref:F-actin-capping protein subunit beta n=1 Tax=Rhodotorula toruloides TaxID=5286 RepID=A0A511KM28_RHOTO|nr:WASH complex, F-actin capping protein, beta subunit [Rhodotorula toruloides]
MEDPLTASLDLLRRLPPQQIAQNLALLTDTLLPDLADDLLSSVDQPLAVKVDSSSREYLVCDYNRDGDSYRPVSSPWTNAYDPPLSDGTEPSPKLRSLEVSMNDAFDVYRDLYYEGGVSSVYLWDTDDGFAGVVLIKKTNDAGASTTSWDSVHVFESLERGRQCHYKLTSTVMLYMTKPLAVESELPGGEGKAQGEGEVALGGSMTRQHELSAPLDPTSPASLAQSHIVNIGKMVEDMELKMRNLLGEVYFSKTKDILSSLRTQNGLDEQAKHRALQGELVGLLKGRKVAA